jgi:hypothetical protein
MGDQLALSTGSNQSARYGALLQLGGNPTRKWLLNGRLDRFQKLTAWSWLRWASPKTRTMEGDLILIKASRYAPPPFATVNVADMTPPFAGFPTRWAWNVRMRTTTVTLHATPPSLITDSYKGSYETPDGVLVPISEPTDLTAPVPVPGNPTPRPIGIDPITRQLLDKLFTLKLIPKPTNP